MPCCVNDRVDHPDADRAEQGRRLGEDAQARVGHLEQPWLHQWPQRSQPGIGENLVDAEAVVDQRTGEPVVSFRFDEEGARRFGQATQDNVGRQLAIIVDEKVLSAPQIREPILGGSGQVSGNFTAQSARDLAVLLRTGPMPAKLALVAQRFVPDEQ